MKNKLFFTVLLALLAFSLSAQKGLFDLSFGDSREAAVANLVSKGFTKGYDSGSTTTMNLPDADYIESVELYFGEKNSTLVSWVVTYKPQEDEDIEEIALNAVISWHGEEYDYNDVDEEWFWSLDEDHYVVAKYDWDYYYFLVEYVGPGAEF